ncbi:hypothetical protein A2671_01905 [Candidatus Kaiserbacteria bacterium RIFCSPHIGHO2_01_FULL_49_13]|uniref:Uncharacterized protein n=1 Tax=Candidatus Kaiserbacteria bacterium RIFCSPHIGHO2_01_FULL_49_13 TaxID=1798477 RepID=A0A1F6CDK7_9BACT|nr:MAG: hypothetical protein A2671_01905 [Candidatus Kaiserbacteria bacterium RIFCSPHIGHO2_01_FULL_49_13]
MLILDSQIRAAQKSAVLKAELAKEKQALAQALLGEVIAVTLKMESETGDVVGICLSLTDGRTIDFSAEGLGAKLKDNLSDHSSRIKMLRADLDALAREHHF